MARLGGLTRAKNLTPEERRASALKASRAAAKARCEKAKLRKEKQMRPLGNLMKDIKKVQRKKKRPR